MNNLILCGFMGCGKTTIGWQLARQLELEYLDLDEQIQQENGCTIPELFQRFGETHFRQLEHEAVAGLAKRVNCVVSTGGGAHSAAAADFLKRILASVPVPLEET